MGSKIYVTISKCFLKVFGLIRLLDIIALRFGLLSPKMYVKISKYFLILITLEVRGDREMFLR